MSADLFITVPRMDEFSYEACLRFITVYEFTADFYEGFDLCEDMNGWLPCRLTVDDKHVDTGFEVSVSSEEPHSDGYELILCSHDDFGWMLAHAIGGYVVSVLGGVVDDPQEGHSWGPNDSQSLDEAVTSLLVAARDH